MNCMEAVANLLGVEFDKDFKCNESPCTYRITKYGVRCNGVLGADSLTMLLDGTLTIKRQPWKPKEGEQYWLVLPPGEITYLYWHPWKFSIILYKLGNCYRTREEAEANLDKWVAFYASDEVLEV